MTAIERLSENGHGSAVAPPGIVAATAQSSRARLVSRLLNRPVRSARPAGTSISGGPVQPIDVVLMDGTELRLVLKDLTRKPAVDAPAFLHDPLREMEIYERVLALDPVSAPTLHGAGPVSAEPQWLLLERVEGRALEGLADFRVWRGVAMWLGETHAHFARQTRALGGLARIRSHDPDSFRLWLRRARAFNAGADHRPARDARRILAWIADRHERLIERIVAQPQTLVHGAFHSANVLIERKPFRVRPINWEFAAIGAGPFDLAALTQSRRGRERLALARAYHAALTAHDVATETLDAFTLSLDCCRLQLAIQWLGWSRRGGPPTGTSPDWLAEAERLARRLDL